MYFNASIWKEKLEALREMFCTEEYEAFTDHSNEYEDMSGRQNYRSNNVIEDTSEYVYADFIASSKVEWVDFQ